MRVDIEGGYLMSASDLKILYIASGGDRSWFCKPRTKSMRKRHAWVLRKLTKSQQAQIVALWGR